MYIAGIDEVGRGPLAGPVSIGVVWVKEGVDLKEKFPLLNDSKKLSEKRREEIYEKAKLDSDISYVVISNTADVIDTKGIEFAIKDAIARGCASLPKDTFVYLDGRLKAPESFKQETVVGGDAKIPAISLASIMAKVERDRYMKKVSEEYPEYGFAKHKGYGTKAHMEAIVESGFCDLHRQSFCRNLIEGV